ncbi:MAG: nucleoside hydrolase [Solobacterium sp.]|nr:nucleoside hydrolase [Solobacterium sp.]
MRTILMDGDPGHDDTVAFLLALAFPERFRIAGFTTVAGNSTAKNCTGNILKVMDYLGVSIPVAAGYESPLVRKLDTAAKYHGETGLDGLLSYPPAVSKPLEKHAIEFLKETILSSKEKITLVTMGPLTNIAVLLKTWPEVLEKIEEIVMMGGSFASGNSLAKSEFNMYADPEAAKIVFDSDAKITMATIEACFSGGLLLTEQETLKDGGKVSRLVYDILKYYSRYAVKNGWDRTAVFDMTTILYLLSPEIFSWRDMKVDIELSGAHTRGMTVCDDRGPTYLAEPENPRRVLLGAEREEVAKLFFAGMHALDQRFE